jgi:hypothetical protein
MERVFSAKFHFKELCLGDHTRTSRVCSRELGTLSEKQRRKRRKKGKGKGVRARRAGPMLGFLQ